VVALATVTILAGCSSSRLSGKGHPSGEGWTSAALDHMAPGYERLPAPAVRAAAGVVHAPEVQAPGAEATLAARPAPSLRTAAPRGAWDVPPPPPPPSWPRGGRGAALADAGAPAPAVPTARQAPLMRSRTAPAVRAVPYARLRPAREQAPLPRTTAFAPASDCSGGT
jgi:hypothetical protein